MVKTSIVIVCMNNPKNLYPCLESIKKHTIVPYETFVVAYLFSPENLAKAKKDFPWVIFIESNEIRGFSENNNLALRLAQGEYCFVVNDDTEMKMPVIDELVKTIESMSSDVAIVSPVTLNADGSIQRCGKRQYTLLSRIFDFVGISRYVFKKSKYVNQEGLFRTYNISGACFLIKTEVFKKIGFFDERYFFCPEDIALSTKLNCEGYSCWVQNAARITHFGGGTWSKTLVATKPASVKGDLIFYGNGNFLKEAIFRFFAFFNYSLKVVYWMLKIKTEKNKRKTMIEANKNAIIALFSSKTPKELFVRFYSELQRKKN